MFAYYKNKANKMRISLKAKYVADNLERTKDPRGWWCGVKKILGTGGKDSITSFINNEFNGETECFIEKANTFFTSVACDIPQLDRSQLVELMATVTHW